MDLLILVDEERVINPHYLGIKVIADIWKRDHGVVHKDRENKSVRIKKVARRELDWIYFMEHWASIYQSYTIIENREKKVKEVLGLDPAWKEDKVVAAAREWYAQTQLETSPDIKGLNSSRKAIASIEEFLDTIDLTGPKNRMPTGAAIYKPKDIASAIKELQAARKSVKEQELDIRKAQVSVKRIRGGGVAGLYED